MKTRAYLVELILAPLGVIDRGAVPVVPEVSRRDEPITTCAGQSGGRGVSRQASRVRAAGGAKDLTVVPGAAGD